MRVVTMTDRCAEGLEDECVIALSPDTGRDLHGDEARAQLDDFLDHIDGIDRDQRHAARYGFDHRDPYQTEQVGFDAPLVFELGGIRSLLANWAFVQSAMSIEDPDRLLLDYTRLMMGFLLFNPSPETIEIIGLGGGSLAKYCYRHLPDASIVGVEIDPEVIAVGERFLMPPEDERFEIVCTDGAEFVRQDFRTCDVLLVDGFDSDGQVPQLCSSEFYRDCHLRLNPGGIFVANLCDLSWKHASVLARVREHFATIIVVPVEDGMNWVVFAFKDEQACLDRGAIRQIACSLDETHPMSFSPLAEEILGRLPAVANGHPLIPR